MPGVVVWLFSGIGGTIAVAAIGAAVKYLRRILGSAHTEVRKFGWKSLKYRHVKRAARSLHGMVREKWRIPPDIIIGVNLGGLITAAVMNSTYADAVKMGFIQMSGAGPGGKVAGIVLPSDIHPRINNTLRILVVDAKLKSGHSAKAAREELNEVFKGFDLEVIHAIVLLYVGGTASGRKKIIQECERWPADLETCGLDLKICAAYYTNDAPERAGRIREELKYFP